MAEYTLKGMNVVPAHKYKLNNVCNAGIMPLSGYKYPEFLTEYAQNQLQMHFNTIYSVQSTAKLLYFVFPAKSNDSLPHDSSRP